jgi:hypothetical protein
MKWVPKLRLVLKLEKHTVVVFLEGIIKHEQIKAWIASIAAYW